MKYRFNVSLRGNVNFPSQSELSTAITTQLSAVEGFTLMGLFIEVWQDGDGMLRDFDGLHRFTIQLRGAILADSQVAVEGLINAFCTMYPEFVLTWQSVEGITDGTKLIAYNDDGSMYVEPTEEVTTKETAVTENGS